MNRKLNREVPQNGSSPRDVLKLELLVTYFQAKGSSLILALRQGIRD